MYEFEMDRGTFVGQYRSYYSDGSLYEEGQSRSSLQDLAEFQSTIKSQTPALYISTDMSYVYYGIDSTTVINPITYEIQTEIVTTMLHSRHFLNAPLFIYWPNGQVKLDAIYKNGDNWGHRAYYYEDGSLALLRYNDDSTHIVIAAWENGQQVIENGTGQMTGRLIFFMEDEAYRTYHENDVYYYQDYRLCKAYYLYDLNNGIYRTKYYD